MGHHEVAVSEHFSAIDRKAKHKMHSDHIAEYDSTEARMHSVCCGITSAFISSKLASRPSVGIRFVHLRCGESRRVCRAADDVYGCSTWAHHSIDSTASIAV